MLEVLDVEEGEEDWVIIAEDASLFITSDASEHKDFCVAETLDGLAAVFCDKDKKQHPDLDENSIIISLCCPPHLLVKVGKLNFIIYSSKSRLCLFSGWRVCLQRWL